MALIAIFQNEKVIFLLKHFVVVPLSLIWEHIYFDFYKIWKWYNSEIAKLLRQFFAITPLTLLVSYLEISLSNLIYIFRYDFFSFMIKEWIARPWIYLDFIISVSAKAFSEIINSQIV